MYRFGTSTVKPRTIKRVCDLYNSYCFKRTDDHSVYCLDISVKLSCVLCIIDI